MATVLIGGGTGMIGSRLSKLLTEQGHTVLHLSRTRNLQAKYPAYQWDLQAGTIDEEAMERADYIFNFAGAGIADKLWTKSRKELIISSRVDTARLLKKYIARDPSKYKAYLAASAIGYYDDRGDDLMTEDAPPGDGFLAKSTLAWEAATQEVASTGIRTAGVRIGLVMSTKDGVLPKLKMSFNFFVGSYFGDGSAWYSWIHIDDLCRMFIHLMENEGLTGFYNGVAPNPYRNKELVKVLKNVLGKPALLAPVPAPALRLGMGEMADAVLGSTKVSAEKIQATGFEFEFPELHPALEDLFKRKV